MENNKNPSFLDEGDAIKHFSLGSLMAKERKSPDSSPNFAQDLIDSIILLPSFTKISCRNEENYLKVSPISPAYNSNGLFVQSQEDLSKDAWEILRRLRC